MKRIAFYGKGGIGKSTISTSASLVMARMGHRVLHVGCDPKHDSSMVLVKDPKKFKTVIDQVFGDADDLEREDLLMEGIEGIECVGKVLVPSEPGQAIRVWSHEMLQSTLTRPTTAVPRKGKGNFFVRYLSGW